MNGEHWMLTESRQQEKQPMSERTCGNCRSWFSTSKTNGVCRRNPPAANDDGMWVEITAKGWCGEWADGTITPEQEEKRELVRRFAVAIAGTEWAAGYSESEVWRFANNMADADLK